LSKDITADKLLPRVIVTKVSYVS